MRSERQFCERLEYDLLFKWFLDQNIDMTAFDALTFSKNRQRLLDHDVARQFFQAVLNEARQRQLLSEEHVTDRLQTLRRTRSDTREPVDTAHLCLIGRAIEAWLQNAGAEEWTLVLEALQVTVEASRQRVIPRGILPGEVPKSITIERTSGCSFESANRGVAFISRR